MKAAEATAGSACEMYEISFDLRLREYLQWSPSRNGVNTGNQNVGERISNYAVTKRRSLRLAARGPASVVLNLASRQKRVPCLVLDASKEGFRLRGNVNLRRGEMVELILDEGAFAGNCNVVWVGKAGSKHEGEAGLEMVQASSSKLQQVF
jgi:hypothetical protein